MDKIIHNCVLWTYDITHMFRIKFTAKCIFWIFLILRINEMASFCKLIYGMTLVYCYYCYCTKHPFYSHLCIFVICFSLVITLQTSVWYFATGNEVCCNGCFHSGQQSQNEERREAKAGSRCVRWKCHLRARRSQGKCPIRKMVWCHYTYCIHSCCSADC